MRKNRIRARSGVYHCIVRGVDRQNIFYDDDDRDFFISLLTKYGEKYSMSCSAYSLLDNHAHFLYTDRENNISRFMQTVCSVYARYFNRKYDRIGHLFQDRFLSEPVEDNLYYMTVIRYILQNPMKAGLSGTCRYRWNSYDRYGKESRLISSGLIMKVFGSFQTFYRYINEKNDDECLEQELKPSEKMKNQTEKIKKLLGTETPRINLQLPAETIRNSIRILRDAGFSINTISRITGVGRFIVQHA